MPQKPNKALQLTPSRTALLSYDRLSFLSISHQSLCARSGQLSLALAYNNKYLKTTTIAIIILLVTTYAHAANVEDKLASLQTEEASAVLMYRSENPRLIRLQDQIADLLKIKDIKNEKYYNFLKEELICIRAELSDAQKRLNPNNPRFLRLNAEIKFIQDTLNSKANKTLQLTPSRLALLSHDRFSFPSTSLQSLCARSG